MRINRVKLTNAPIRRSQWVGGALGGVSAVLVFVSVSCHSFTARCAEVVVVYVCLRVDNIIGYCSFVVKI